MIIAAITIPSPIRDWTRTAASSNWGNIASVWGLFVSIYVLFIAKGARTAARQAVSAEKLRTALDELANAADKCTHVGLYAQSGDWPLARLRAAEVQATCRATIARWEKDGTLKDSRNKLLRVAENMLSIVEAIDNQAPNKQTILEAQRDSDNKLAVVVGRMKQDSGSV